LPVSTATTSAVREMVPAAVSLRMPATVAAEAGSHPIPQSPTMALASAISCSVTFSTTPCELSTSRRAFGQDTGSPILIAVARVSGWVTARKPSAGACIRS